MAKVYIKSISIQGFRGINNQSTPFVIDFNTKGVTSIFAENGKGKSSIYEALYYCLYNRFPKLDNLHREIRDEKSKKNLFYNGEGKIEIDFIDDKGIENEINFTINQNGERIISNSSLADPQLFLDSIYCSHNFLDYNTFIKILLNSPEETGKLFSDLVGFAEFPLLKEKIEKITRSQNINTDFQKTTKENQITQYKGIISENEIKVLELMNEIGCTVRDFNEKNIIAELKKIIKSEFNTTINILSKIDSEDLIKNKAGNHYNEDVHLLNSLEEDLATLNKFYDAIENFKSSELSQIRHKLKNAYKQVDNSREFLSRELFDKAIEIYENSDFDKNVCVLCETPNLEINGASFFYQVKQKTMRFKELKENLERIKEEFKALIDKEQILLIEDYLIQVGLITQQEKIISISYHNTQELSKDSFTNKIIESNLKRYKKLLKDKIRITKGEVKKISLKVPKDFPELVSKSIKVKEISKKIIECQEKRSEVETTEIYLNLLSEWIEFASEIKAEFEDSFNSLMANISSDINKNTKDFFFGIMKNTEISPLIIKEARAQKINILLDKFYSTDNKKASSLLSESYRNALCLSIYFASALKNKSKGNFIVLDDICSSFDSGHQYYLLDIIRDEISLISKKHGKQVIFLTHDGLLKKSLPKYSDSDPKWTHYSLTGNRTEMSIRPYTSDHFKNLLVNRINNGENVGSDMRSFYESVLLEIIEELDIQIPFSLINSNDQKVISKILTSLSDIVQLKVKTRKTRIRNLPSKSDFKTYIQDVSNNLSHFASSSSSSLSPAVLFSYVDYIIQIRQKFQYNCTCVRNLGWTYYKSLNGGKKDKNCTCSI